MIWLFAGSRDLSTTNISPFWMRASFMLTPSTVTRKVLNGRGTRSALRSVGSSI